MENASKALIMAAGVLIGVLVLSLGVYLFVTFGTSAREIRDDINSARLTEFNAKFNMYADRDDITIYDIISLVNLAQENNSYYKDISNYKSDYVIDIYLDTKDTNSTGMNADIDGSVDQFEVNNKKQKLLETYNEVIKRGETEDVGEIAVRFKCKSISYHPNGRIYKMKFVKN